MVIMLLGRKVVSPYMFCPSPGHVFRQRRPPQRIEGKSKSLNSREDLGIESALSVLRTLEQASRNLILSTLLRKR
jgi:hypothetical protein